jgi:hypothetical protein
MANEDVYVSLTSEEQRKYRSELLLAQTEVLNLIKKMQTIKDIRGEKTEYRQKLAREYSSVLEGLKRFNEKMPNPKIPKNLLDKNPVADVTPFVKKVAVEKTYVAPQIESAMDEDALERELREIQEQLKMITG